MTNLDKKSKMHKLDLNKDVDAFIIREIQKRMTLTPDIAELRQFERHLVFVYGTLKNGFSNHTVIKPDAKYMGRARSHDRKFKMKTNPAFPVVLDEQNEAEANFVYGEIYAVTPDNMMALDRLEGNGSMYTRRKVLFKMLDQHPEGNPKACILHQAWIYVGGSDYWNDGKNLKDVPLSIPLNSGAATGYDWDRLSYTY